jgi:molecular chaperone DnaJ
MADYYELLNVPRDATSEQIKKAYRKLAMEYHPDRNNGSTEAEMRFKELSEAYETLRDPQKRAAYDRYGKEGVRGQGSAGGPFHGGFDLHDAIETFMRDFGGGGGFEDIFGGRRQGGRRRRTTGEPLRIRLPLTLEEVVLGATKTVRLGILEVCPTCEGSGSADRGEAQVCPTCNGGGEERIVQRSVFGQFVSVTTCRSCGGEGTVIRNPCRTCNGEGRVREEREVPVEVPAGVTSENFITLRGKGNAGIRGGSRGDIMVLLEVQEDPRFSREGSHLVTEVVVTLAQAALGDEVEAPTVTGSIQVEVPAGTQSGQAIRIRGEGVPELHGGERGDLFVRIRVWTPTKLSKEQRHLLEQLRAAEDPAPTEVDDSEEVPRGFWSKVREAFTG